jgi:hypothetical protein
LKKKEINQQSDRQDIYVSILRKEGNQDIQINKPPLAREVSENIICQIALMPCGYIGNCIKDIAIDVSVITSKHVGHSDKESEEHHIHDEERFLSGIFPLSIKCKDRDEKNKKI